MTDTDTDAGPTPGPWHYQEDSDNYTHIVRPGERFVVQLPQDSSGAMEANARLIAAAGTAAHELPDEYDPVEAVEALPQLLKTLEALDETMEAPDMAEGTLTPMGMHDYIKDALQKARRDDE